MSRTKVVPALIGLLLGLAVGVIGTYSSVAPASHEERDPGHSSEGDQHDDHDAPGRSGHGEEDHEDDESNVIHLNEAQIADLHLREVPVRRGSLTSTIELPGEVQWNADRLVHISPRVSGIVAGVAKTLGDRVKAGDLLCVLDSKPMGDAKMEYLADLRRFDVAKADFDRAKIVYENTKKLLVILDGSPTPDAALAKAKDLPVGENKNKLLTAYTRMEVNRRNSERTRELAKSNIASEADLLEAQGAYDISRADYLSTREEITFNLQINFLKAERDFAVAETEMQNSERALHILGLSNKDTEELANRGRELDLDISRNELRSPIAGVIVERHLTRGELVSTDTRLYTITDPANVWVMGRAYERDIRKLAVGQKASVRLDAFPDELFEGVVDYVGSQLDVETRTVQTRVVLPNPDGRFRRGMFGTMSVFAESTDSAREASIIVPIGAIQRTKDGFVVFKVVGPGEYEQVPVRILSRSREFTGIDSELTDGDRVVIGDTFILKSEAGQGEMGEGHHH